MEIMKVQQPAARLPARATCGPGSPRRASASGGSLELVEQVRPRAPSWPRSTHLHGLRRAGRRGARSRSCRRARSRSPRSRTAARSTRSRSRSPTTSSSSTCATTPTRTTGRTTPAATASMVAAQMVFMNLTDPHASANAGHFRPLTAAHPPGLGLRREAARGVRHLLRGRDPALRPDLALPRAAPRRTACRPAASRSICGTFIGGPHPDTGRHFTIVEPQVGGWGALARRATATAPIFSGFHGDTFNCPAEVAEARYGLYVDRLALNDAPGGEGEHRGGKGIVARVPRALERLLLHLRLHAEHAPAVGARRRPRRLAELRRGDPHGRHGRGATPSSRRSQVNEGDVIRIHTGNGGGYGDPRQRAREQVLEDMRNGFVTRARASSVYGVDVE